MKKLYSILALLAFTFLVFSKSAKADLEILKAPLLKPMSAIQEIMANAVIVNENISKVQREVAAGQAGITSAVNTYDKVKNDPLSMTNKDMGVKHLEIFGDDPFDVKKSKKALEERKTKYIGEASTHLRNVAKAKNEEILREEVATLYALGLAMHASLLAQQKEDATEQENNRDMIQATYLKAIETTSRLNRILLLESELARYQVSLRAFGLKERVDPEEQADADEGGV